MSQTHSPIRPTFADPGTPQYPMSVELYHDLIRRGILTENDPVELVEGLLVFHMPKNPPHRFIVGAVRRAVEKLLPDGWHYDSEGSLTLNDGEPEPDGLIIRGDPRDFTDRHPRPRDIAVAIEVSDSTLSIDRGNKLRSYARAGVAVYWIINVADRSIEVYSAPRINDATPTYAARQDYGEADVVPLVLQGTPLGHVVVKEILP